MVTFCLGSARQKRDYVKQIKDGVLLDNTEVIFCVSENGRNYFAYAPVPFGGFTVRDYLAYRRALCDTKPSDDQIKALGINPDKRIKSLCTAQMRCVQYLEKKPRCGSAVIVNLDGCRYSRKNMRALNALLTEADDAYVFVTDRRFSLRAKYPKKLLLFGKNVRRRTPRFYAAAVLAKRVGATRISVM